MGIINVSIRGVFQWCRILGLGPRGHRFESYHSDKEETIYHGVISLMVERINVNDVAKVRFLYNTLIL